MPDGVEAYRPELRRYDVKIPIRGCRFNLSEIADAYNELQELSSQAGERILARLVQPASTSDAQWATELDKYRRDAFSVTVSVIGGDDNVSRYGDSVTIFASASQLPKPINTLLLTNENSFRAHAQGQLPTNRFSIWIHFHKETIFKSTFLLSEATINLSEIIINADDPTFLRAAQTIVAAKLKRRRLWYRSIHERYAYDVGLWIFTIPYALLLSSSKADALLPAGKHSDLSRFALFFYLFGLTMVGYRLFFAYLKWAFPVNILDENVDRTSTHRAVFGVIVLGLIVNAFYDV